MEAKYLIGPSAFALCENGRSFFVCGIFERCRGPPLEFGSQPNFRKSEDKILKKELLRNIPGYASFCDECSFEKCEDEYPGWTGIEKYIVFSNLTRDELTSKYPEIVAFISPYILIDRTVSTALVSYKRNDDKHHWRAVHRESGFGFDELTEFIHDELLDDRMEEDVMLRIMLQEAMDQLTDAQRRRVQLRYFEGLTYAQIAKLEQTTDPAILKSISVALRKMKKFLEEG